MKEQQEMNDRNRAVALAQSMRGQYIISQALCLAIRTINSRPEELQEPSNVADMEFLVQHLFPIYRVVESSEEQFVCSDSKTLDHHISRVNQALKP